MTSKKTTQDTEGTSLRTNTSSYKIRKFNGKIEISQGSKKSNIILRGLEGHPKTLMQSRISLVELVNEMVNLISSELANEKENFTHEKMWINDSFTH